MEQCVIASIIYVRPDEIYYFTKVISPSWFLTYVQDSDRNDNELDIPNAVFSL